MIVQPIVRNSAAPLKADLDFGLLISKSLFVQDPIDIMARARVNIQTIFILLRMMLIFRSSTIIKTLMIRYH